jgi:hypothetical protein
VFSGEYHEDVEAKVTLTQKSTPVTSPSDKVGANKKTSTTSTSDKITKTKTTNLNLVQGKKVHALRTATVTSYFDKGWNAFAQEKDGSIQWIPEQIVGIGEDFHSQVDDDKLKTTLYKVRWRLIPRSW